MVNKTLLLCGLFALFILQTLADGAYLGKNEQGLDVFKIDLNDQPEFRFLGPAAHYKDKIVALLD